MPLVLDQRVFLVRILAYFFYVSCKKESMCGIYSLLVNDFYRLVFILDCSLYTEYNRFVQLTVVCNNIIKSEDLFFHARDRLN